MPRKSGVVAVVDLAQLVLDDAEHAGHERDLVGLGRSQLCSEAVEDVAVAVGLARAADGGKHRVVTRFEERPVAMTAGLFGSIFWPLRGRVACRPLMLPSYALTGSSASLTM